MENQIPRPQRCGKCKALNRPNAITCFNCRTSFLSSYSASNYQLVERGDTTPNPLIRFAFVLFVFLVLFIGGIYLLPRLPFLAEKTPNDLQADLDAAVRNEKQALNAAEKSTENSKGWYEQSYWSWIFRTPSADEIFEQNLKASGGRAMLETITNLRMTGSVTASMMPATSQHQDIDLYASRLTYERLGAMTGLNKKPGKSLMALKLQVGPKEIELTQAYDGAFGWQRQMTSNGAGAPVNEIKNLTGKELEELRSNTLIGWGDYTAQFKNEHVKGVKKVAGKSCYVVGAERNDETKTPYNLYFETNEGLLVKMERNDMTMLLEDYRYVEGVRMPFLLTAAKSEQGRIVVMRFILDKMTMNLVIDDQVFVKP